MWDGEAFGKSMAQTVAAAIERATAPLLKRIADLEGRELPAPRDGANGADGRDGIDGKDGAAVTKDMVIEAITSMPQVIDAVVARYLAEHPPADGKDGGDGRDGAAGIDGKDGVGLAGAVVDGEGGLIVALTNGETRHLGQVVGRDGHNGADGRDGVDGKDGVGLAGAVVDREGGLVITLTNGDVRALGQVVGRDGQNGAAGARGLDGQDGRDGFGFDDMDVERSDERTLVLKFTKGDVTQSFEINLEHPIYRGVFTEGKGYEIGDTVTWAGSLWHCDAPTIDKPGDASSSWTLAAKRGRDGKDGKGEKGEPGSRGERGEPGRDGRNYS